MKVTSDWAQQKCCSETRHGGLMQNWATWTSRALQLAQVLRRDQSGQFSLRYWLAGISPHGSQYKNNKDWKTYLKSMDTFFSINSVKCFSLLTWATIRSKDSIKERKKEKSTKFTSCIYVILLGCYVPTCRIYPVFDQLNQTVWWGWNPVQTPVDPSWRSF